MEIIYFIVGLFSTTVGSISGLGGGVIIKPVLDLLGHYNISTIGVLSSFTVFSMSVVSLGNNIKSKVKIDGSKTIALAIGSIAGGTLGNEAFTVFLNIVGNDMLATKLQSAILFLLMLSILILYINDDKVKAFKERRKLNKLEKITSSNIGIDITETYISQGKETNTKVFKDISVCLMWGLILGVVASFLSIGGGPLNVIVLMYLLNMDVKQSSIHSIVIIFFSQGSKLLSVFLNEGFGAYNLEVVIYMIVGGISGGLIGSYLSTIMNKESVKKIFIYCMVLIIFFNLYNIIK